MESKDKQFSESSSHTPGKITYNENSESYHSKCKSCGKDIFKNIIDKGEGVRYLAKDWAHWSTPSGPAKAQTGIKTCSGDK